MHGDLQIGTERAKLWLPRRRVTTLAQAAAFVESVGFALLFPAAGINAPSLWEAIADPDAEPFAHGMGEEESRLWEWKDELGRQGLTWYGKFLYRRGSLLSPRLLAALYPGPGEVTDHRDLDLSAPAHEIAEALLGGALTTSALRQLVGDRTRYERGIGELHRHLLVTAAGVQQQSSGWPAGLVDVTCRVFDVTAGPDHEAATRQFVTTMVTTTPKELSKAYGWPLAQARAALDRLVANGQATQDANGYRAR